MDPVLERMLNAMRRERIYTALGLGAQSLILKRVDKGDSLEGGQFKGGSGYSAGYKKKRESEGLRTDVINLSFSTAEGLLSEIKFTTDPANQALNLDISDNEKKQIAYYLNESGTGRNRIKFPFWGLTEKEEKELTSLARDEIFTVMLSELT